jgi:hypothetical protein
MSERKVGQPRKLTGAETPEQAEGAVGIGTNSTGAGPWSTGSDVLAGGSNPSFGLTGDLLLSELGARRGLARL